MAALGERKTVAKDEIQKDNDILHGDAAPLARLSRK